MWLGGEAEGFELEHSVEVITRSGAFVAGLQEVKSYQSDGTPKSDNGLKIAELLGWYHFDQGTSAIISKYPIIDSSPKRLGVKLALESGQYLWFFNCHFNHMPYQPYQLGSIPYGDFPYIETAGEAHAYAEMARGSEVQQYVQEMETLMAEGWPMILTGDFNEPSWLDWTERAVTAGLSPLKVDWPATRAMYHLGLTDAYRTIHPDEIMQRGETWSSIDSPGELHDRIDFIFYSGTSLEVLEASTIGGEDEISDIPIRNYPSDHRAVVATFRRK